MSQLVIVVAVASQGAPSSTTATSPGCPSLEVRGTVPWDGAVVPVDVAFRALVDPAYEACWTPLLELFDDLGAPVASVADGRGNGLFDLRPQAPLQLGSQYTFRVTDPVYGDVGSEITVTVGEPGTASTVAPTLVLEVDHQCEDARVSPSVRLETSEPVSGLMTIEYVVDGVVSPVFVPVVDETVLEDRSTFYGSGVEVCASVRFEGLSGEEAWSVARTCAPEFHCPTYEPPDAVEFTMEAVCGEGVPSTRLVADLDFAPADPDAFGTLAVEVTTDLGSQGAPWTRRLAGADGDVHLDVTVLGGHDVCFELVMFGSMGEELWRDGPYCSAEPVTCPGEGRDLSPAEEGCGCGGGAGPAAFWLPVLVGAGLRRRRG